MAIKRIFLGIECPALPAVADWLLSKYSAGNMADLSQVSVVVPGARAGRRLLEILVDRARQGPLCLTPPLIETVGKLPEQLYKPKLEFATDLVQRLIWAQTLSQASPDLVEAVIPRPPAHRDILHWMAYGDLLRRQHSELAADGLNFQKVAECGKKLEGFNEQPRWRALQQLQEAYLSRLDQLELWDIQTARLEAVRRREPRTERDIVLVGTVDLNVTMRQMLDQVADRVTALIFAPENWQERFDEHGCLIPSAWEQIALPISTETVQIADGPADQSDVVMRELASLEGKYRADEIVIGVPDEELVPDLERRLSVAGVTARWGPGQAFPSTSPYRLFAAIAAYLDHERYAEFAALVRHPDLAAWFERENLQTDWLERLDRYQSHHLPFRIVSEDTQEQSGDILHQVGKSAQRLLGDLVERPRPVNQWAEPIWDLVMRVYGQRPLQADVLADRATYAVCKQLRECLQEYSKVPSVIMPSISASQAIRWLLEELSSALVPATMTADSIELLGWLELPLDDAPVAIVTGFNEGFIPESLNSDLFMPNTLRQRLGVLDNARRYARDAYAVSVIVASRPHVRWIVGRRNHDNDPLAPSRLLFACDAETAVERAQQFFQPVSNRDRVPVQPVSEASEKRLEIPRPRKLDVPIKSLRVTAFRDYIACPYRFYLRHIEHLETVTDTLDELDAAGFGSMAHEVMRRFGLGSSRDSVDVETIRIALEQELDRYAAESYGSQPLPAVLVQIEQLRWRLRAFAERQAAWAAQGWRIEYVETANEYEQGASLVVDGQPFLITGRIDRIDVHQVTGERAILDYKTSDAGRPPEDTHRCRGEWTDLQLPLYRHLASAMGIKGPFNKLGYILLPKAISETAFVFAEWTPEELKSADELAQHIVRNIRREIFFPPTDPPPDFSDDFSPICQDTVLDR